MGDARQRRLDLERAPNREKSTRRATAGARPVARCSLDPRRALPIYAARGRASPAWPHHRFSTMRFAPACGSVDLAARCAAVSPRSAAGRCARAADRARDTRPLGRVSQPWRFVAVEDDLGAPRFAAISPPANAAALDAAGAGTRPCAMPASSSPGSTRRRATSPSSSTRKPSKGRASGGARCPRWSIIRRWPRPTPCGWRRAPRGSAWAGCRSSTACGGRDPRSSPGLEADRLFLSRLSGRGGRGADARNFGLGDAAPGALVPDPAMTHSAMSSTAIRVGIGGWVFPPWRGAFYPPGLTQARELSHASRQVTAIEINGTFYGSQKPASFRRWHDETPGRFRVLGQGLRFVTHRRDLATAGLSIERFFASGVVELARSSGRSCGSSPRSCSSTKPVSRPSWTLLPREIDGLAAAPRGRGAPFELCRTRLCRAAARSHRSPSPRSTPRTSTRPSTTSPPISSMRA